MLMQSIRPRWRDGLVRPRPCPADFELKFIELGRLACREHYHVGRFVIDHWLETCGKDRLIAKRAEHWRKQRAAKREALSRKEMEKLFSRRVRDRRKVKPAIARHAAHYLREIRNGGWIISPAGDGDWWVGSRRRSAAQLVDLAKAKGFTPSLRDMRGSG